MESDPQTEARASPRKGSRQLRARVSGCLSFLFCFVACMYATLTVTEWAVRNLPRTEGYEALNWDGLALNCCCGGMVVSLAMSALVAAGAAWLAKGRS